VNLNTDNGPLGAATGEFNGDGRTDIVTTNFSNDNISVYMAIAGTLNTLSISKTGTGSGSVSSNLQASAADCPAAPSSHPVRL
jgi:hypothetical protein